MDSEVGSVAAIETVDTGSAGVESVVSTPEVVAEPGAHESAAPETQATEQPKAEAQPAEKEEDLSEFKGQVARQVVSLVKEAPELKELFQKYPKLENSITAAFRRDNAFREIFPTVAEAREIRNALPNGLQDLKEIQESAETAEMLDSNYLNADAQGNFPGHAQIIRDMREMNPQAFSALVKSGIREWAQANPEDYSETFSNILGATFQSERVFSHVAALQKHVENSDDPALKQAINELADWIGSFNPETKRNQRPSPEQERLRSEREQFQREKQAEETRRSQSFNIDTTAKSEQLQRSIVESHQLIRALPQSIPPNRKARIVNDIIIGIRQHLSQTRPFMRKLETSWRAGDQKAVLDVQRSNWSQPWLLNKYVRKVLAEETPQVVQASRNAPPVRQAVPVVKPPANGAAQKKAPYKQGNQWFRGDGTPFKAEEILLGKHLRA